jgi:hypothetical protein
MPSSHLAAIVDMPFFPIAVMLGLLPFPWRKGARRPSAEPPLDDLIADPIVRRLMASDGVGMAQMLEIIARAQARLR